MPDAPQQEQIALPPSVTVGQLAELLEVELTTLIAELFKNGIMVTVNDRVDFDTAEIIVEELGLEVELTQSTTSDKADSARDQHRAQSQARAESKNARQRPPIIAVMGHVDHGKTTLLDSIGGKDTVKDEAGGITQHISAFQVEQGGRIATFLDTPGHEAFSAIREHGARLTDLVLLVVAADDGVKPQTEEAIKYASRSGVNIMVAVNKVDKAGADVNRVKQQLSDLGLQPEDWGGKTVYVEVSALQKQGLDQLLDMIFLVTDVEEKLSDFDGTASALVIEAHMDKNKGPVAKVLIEHGQLAKGAFLSAGPVFGKVRVLEDSFGNVLESAGPGMPATVYGFKEVPRFGDVVNEFKSQQDAKRAAQSAARTVKSQSQATSNKDLLQLMARHAEVKDVPIVVKADAQGSLKSVMDSINAIDSTKVRPKIVRQGIGMINDGDVLFAESIGGAMIVGFSVGAPQALKQQAKDKGVEVEEFDVIYRLIERVKNYLEQHVETEYQREVKAVIDIQGVFHSTGKALICGGKVTEGRVESELLVDFIREEEKIGTGTIGAIKKQQQEVKFAEKGDMCGIQVDSETGKLPVKVGDRAEIYTINEVKEEIK